MKPVLFVDVDGVISLWGFPSDRCPAGEFVNVDGILHFLSATAAEHLPALSESFELVWCTGWEERANEYLPEVLRLPASLPFLTFERSPGRTHAHWKLDAIEAYAGDRALAWIDDAHDDACHVWAARRAAPTLLVGTEPSVGLVDAHAEALRAWAAGLRPAG
ncbi:MAG: HAD domain-containing protein [Solirubrobacteraceae bacterium]